MSPLEDKSDYTIPLGELLKLLKQAGYEVSTKQVLEIQSVLLSSRLLKLDPFHLKFIIAPVLARNEDDQKNIYRIIDSFIAAGRHTGKKKQSSLQRFFKNRKLVFRLKVAAFVLVVATGLLFYFMPKNHPQKIASDNLPLPKNLKNDIPEILPKSDLPQDSLRQNTLPVVASGPFRIKGPAYNGEKIIPIPRDINLQVSLVLGLGFGAILYYLIFFEEKKRMKIKEKKSSENLNMVNSNREDKEGLPIDAENKGQPDKILFPENNYLVQKSREFSVIRANLKKPAFVDFVDLNVTESAYATARNAGFPSFFYGNEWKERKYLLLVEHTQSNSHITQLMNYLGQQFTSGRMPVVKYSFTTDITVLKDNSGKIVYLDDLSHHLKNHHLIIIGDCNSFFDTAENSLKANCADILSRWMHKSVITPVPLPDWSHREDQLQNNQFLIVPAEINAINLLTRAIAENKALPGKKLEKQLKNMYSVSKFNFQSTDDLKSYLNNETLFQLVCSLAVYPRLEWSLTLALFSAILKKMPGDTVSVTLDYDTLLKISRIPWLYTNKLDEATRLKLLHHLHPNTEIIARETILELLSEARPLTDPTSLVSHELDVQYKLNSFFLYAYDPFLYSHFADVKKEIAVYWDNLREWALKERVNSRATGLMPVNKEGQRATVEEFVLEEEKFEKTNMNFLRVMLLTVPAIVLYILFSLTRPSGIYLDQYKNVSFKLVVNKDDTCRKNLTGVIVEREQKQHKTNLNTSGNSDTIQINNVEYNKNLNISLISAGGKSVEFLVSPSHSIVTISADCN